MKKINTNAYFIDIIKVLMIFGTLRLLNIYHKSENNTLELIVLFVVVFGVSYIFRKSKN